MNQFKNHSLSIMGRNSLKKHLINLGICLYKNGRSKLITLRLTFSMWYHKKASEDICQRWDQQRTLHGAFWGVWYYSQ